MTAYADKMAHDKFDGTLGFSIDGGIKDARYSFALRHVGTSLSVTLFQSHPTSYFRTQLSYACY